MVSLRRWRYCVTGVVVENVKNRTSTTKSSLRQRYRVCSKKNRTFIFYICKYIHVIYFTYVLQDVIYFRVYIIYIITTFTTYIIYEAIAWFDRSKSCSKIDFLFYYIYYKAPCNTVKPFQLLHVTVVHFSMVF